MVLSSDPDASSLSSGLETTEQTSALCPSRVFRHVFLSASHSLMVLSVDPEAISLPFGLKATE